MLGAPADEDEKLITKQLGAKMSLKDRRANMIQKSYSTTFASPDKTLVLEEKSHTITPLKKMQNLMNCNNNKSYTSTEEYNIISPGLKKINTQADSLHSINEFSIEKKLIPIQMDQPANSLGNNSFV